MSRIRNLGHNFIRSDKWIYSLMRAGLVSQAASWIDLFTGFALFAWAGFDPGVAAAMGAVVGGIINCYVNFHFTFHCHDISWKAIIVKYVMVWIGSMLLNSFGTSGLYFMLQKWQWLETIGFKPDGYYAAARLAVSAIVSLFWNLLLQARFVYRPTRFDPTAIRFVDMLTLHDRRHADK
ncbi:MAG: hypothetical protein HDR89_09285 [Bacteroides sp.]|nr:hypothetical protein [Bacteroides sp.]